MFDFSSINSIDTFLFIKKRHAFIIDFKLIKLKYEKNNFNILCFNF